MTELTDFAAPVADLEAALAEAAETLRGERAVEAPRLSRPSKPGFGDYSSNAAMLLAPALHEAPRTVAEQLGTLVSERIGPAVDHVEVAGPGFLNLFMADDWCRQALGRVLSAGDSYGAGDPALGESVLVEFVSANPTGPITVASGRHAALGDSLCRVLAHSGHRVSREYYVNDHGTQVRRFGESIGARARGEEPPEDGYRGAYVTDLAGRIPDAGEADPDDLARLGVDAMVEGIKVSLERFRVHFDTFFSERSLHEDGGLDRTLAMLEDRGHLYPSEGALWLRTTAFGDDKDRVLRRSNGEWTYFASDIAHHADKLAGGFDRAIDVLGADHHGYLGRIRAAWQALGGDADRFELPIMQLVNLLEHGRRVTMSKREGDFVTLDELLDDIGVDAARFFLLQRSHDTTLDLDLALARERSQENPVYYVQYAHARIASILRKGGEDHVDAALRGELPPGEADGLHPSSRALLKRVLDFPEEVALSAERRAPHRLTVYAHDLAQDFSAFYRDCRVVGATEDGADESFRISLSVATQRVIAQALGLLGVSAPEEM